MNIYCVPYAIYIEVEENGFPIILKADWNDAYDHIGFKGKGESVWLAMALCRALKQFHDLALFIGDKKIAREMLTKFNALKKIVNKKAWDGKWYIAAINDSGLRIGTNKNKEGKVPLNSQTWSILGNVVPPNRLKSILSKIDKYLNTDYGPSLFLPSYTEYNNGIGRVTAFAPGTKENAAVFSHACAFKIVADCQLGRGEEAFDTFKKLCPMSKVKSNHSHYKVEPYVWAEYIIGPGNKRSFGQGVFTWNTGTTPWMFTAATEWILGIRRDFKGLRIDPCLPKKWRKATIQRPFRGAKYNVTILNPKGVNKGVKQMEVDGKLISGTLVPAFRDKKTHHIKVTMG